jgi:nucleoside-diphosphate-sugar epimerase
LVHAAAVVPIETVNADPRGAYQTNVLGTGNVVSGFLNSNPGAHVTYVSSSHVYRAKQSPIFEDDCLDPLGAYGRTKLAGEYIATDLANSLGGSLCVARVFSLYSNKQKGSFLLPSIAQKLLEADGRGAIEIFGWNNVRDFSSADFHARALAHLSTLNLTGTFNVGSGIGRSILDFGLTHFDFELLNKEKNFDLDATTIVADTSKLVSSGFEYE